MKITKQRLQIIIKEELEKAQKEKAPPADPESKQQLANKFKELYTLVPKVKGLDKIEIILLNKLIDAAIKLSSEGSAKTGLMKALKMLGVKVNE